MVRLTFANGIAPLAVLLMLTVGLPAVFARGTLSQRRLLAAVILTGAVVWVVGAVLSAWQYRLANGALTGAVWDYLTRSALLGLLWGPVLALVWLMRAQGVERRRGLLMRDKGDLG